ncbi:L,D-transpeptidase [Nocardiopsis valliformis]|uniref:L,D-transpeptidase n=1 Tax=Nocardiopsis valliformis TaxID=239974 RepID=UPI00034B960B|nr:Ig-like domain-containing protein [Nocardiopsis valliformis]
MKRRTTQPRLAVTAAALVLLAAGCTSGGDEPGGTSAPGGSGQEQEQEQGPQVEITPAPGATGVAPNTPVRVESADGTITDVRIEQAAADGTADGTAEGETGAEAEGRGSESSADEEDPFAVTGTLSEAGDAWISDWNLLPGAAVTVTVTAADADGEETETVSEFTTLEAVPGQRLELASNFPSSGDVVGVGMPVIINFDLPVTHKAQVENSIEVTAEEETEGAWNWVTDEMAVFRPKEYWDPYQEITVDLRLAGVEAADGVYGVANHRIEFEVGRELISTMHVPDHEMNVTVDGEAVRSIPVSNGAAEERFDTTTSGTHLTMEKYESLVMDSATVGIPEGEPGYYRLDVDWAVRTSNSGEFTHAAPWNSGNIGSANTSNGCTNMSVEDARWFHDQSLMGDILETTGTDRELEWDNGWGYYQRSWDEWLSHSVTGEPQRTDGTGTPGSVHGEGL